MQKRSSGSDLAVIARAKELCSYVLTVTEGSPKRFRFTLVAKLQANALDALEQLLLANEVYVADRRPEQLSRRLAHQQAALTRLKVLGYLAQLAMEQGCILPKQFEVISRHVFDCCNLAGAWMAADRKRFSKTDNQVVCHAEAAGQAPVPADDAPMPSLF